MAVAATETFKRVAWVPDRARRYPSARSNTRSSLTRRTVAGKRAPKHQGPRVPVSCIAASGRARIGLKALRGRIQQLRGHGKTDLRRGEAGVSHVGAQKQQQALDILPLAVPSRQPMHRESVLMIPAPGLFRVILRWLLEILVGSMSYLITHQCQPWLGGA